jgi:hypothetical protein
VDQALGIDNKNAQRWYLRGKCYTALGFKTEAYSMKKMRNLEWGEYRHPEVLQSLTISVNEFK